MFQVQIECEPLVKGNMKKKPASLIGPKKVLEYKEWEEESEGNSIKVIFRKNEVAFDWSEGQIKSSGKATTSDGQNFEGRWEEGPPEHDYGRITFRLFRTVDGEALLVGEWVSEAPNWGYEGHFFIRVSPDATG